MEARSRGAGSLPRDHAGRAARWTGPVAFDLNPDIGVGHLIDTTYMYLKGETALAVARIGSYAYLPTLASAPTRRAPPT